MSSFNKTWHSVLLNTQTDAFSFPRFSTLQLLSWKSVELRHLEGHLNSLNCTMKNEEWRSFQRSRPKTCCNVWFFSAFFHVMKQDFFIPLTKNNMTAWYWNACIMIFTWHSGSYHNGAVVLFDALFHAPEAWRVTRTLLSVSQHLQSSEDLSHVHAVCDTLVVVNHCC